MEKTRRQVALLLIDILVIQLSVFLSFYLRFDGSLWSDLAKLYIQTYVHWAIWFTIAKLVIFSFFQLYNSLWRYASVEELIQIFLASVFGTFGFFTLLYLFDINMPRSIVIISGIFDVFFIGFVRFGYRSLRIIKDYGFNKLNRKLHTKKVLIVGAGSAGATLAKEIKSQVMRESSIVGFIDDDANKQGRLINGITVLGDRYDINRITHHNEVDEIIIALPSIDKRTINEVVDICATTKCKLKILPSLSELLDGRVSVNAIRNVEIDDLLGRDEINLSEKMYSKLIEGKVILITGAGGSIGSELVRQVLRHSPELIVMVDIYENNLYHLQQELLREFGTPNIVALIGSVRDEVRVDEIMGLYKPHVVFHAAAHKHVPLMEESPKEAVKNNVLGAFNVIKASQKHHVERFVQISTDKAVNPTNVMGATKRACEMLIQSMNAMSPTELMAVRFGNVLGSEGSVIPLFKRQIADGGPVTVTHKDIIRYFMTIPEASKLVIQAASLGKGGEIFVLDMGEPIRIYELAEKMIRLSGFEPHKDIAISVTGLRPGEKLFEELLIDDQHTISTELKKIFVEKTNPLAWEEVSDFLTELNTALSQSERDVRIALSNMVKTYVYPHHLDDN